MTSYHEDVHIFPALKAGAAVTGLPFGSMGSQRWMIQMGGAVDVEEFDGSNQ